MCTKKAGEAKIFLEIPRIIISMNFVNISFGKTTMLNLSERRKVKNSRAEKNEGKCIATIL